MDSRNSKYEALFRDSSVWRSIFSLALPSLLTIVVSLLRQGLLLIPLLYGMHALFGFLGIAAAHMAADMGAALIAAVIFAREYRRVKEALS